MKDLTPLIREYEFIRFGKGKTEKIAMVEKVTQKALLVSFFDRFPDEYMRKAWLPKSVVFAHDTKLYLSTAHRIFYVSINPKFRLRIITERLPQDRIDHIRNIFYGEAYPTTLEAVKYRDQYQVTGARRIIRALERFFKRWRRSHAGFAQNG